MRRSVCGLHAIGLEYTDGARLVQTFRVLLFANVEVTANRR
jgi:hypothetical protein